MSDLDSEPNTIQARLDKIGRKFGQRHGRIPSEVGLIGDLVNFESSNLMNAEAAPPPPPPRRRRAIFGTLLAAVIAFLLIAIILAIVSAMGERRLAQLRSQSIAIAPLRSHPALRPALGLQVPDALVVRPTAPRIPDADDRPRVAALDPFNPAPAATIHEPPAFAQQPPPVVPLQPQELYRAARQNSGIPSTLYSSAFLARPDSRVNLDQIPHPSATQDLTQIRTASRLLPDAARELVEQRRPMQTLAERRAQAAMARTAASEHPTQ